MGQKIEGQKVERIFPLVVAVACATVFLLLLPLPRARAQAVSLQEQLAAQYKAVKMGSDTSGYSVVEEGTLLAIQKGGMLGSPYSEKTTLVNKYEGGSVHPPSSSLLTAKKAIFGHFSQTQSQGQETKLFAKGDKVYPMKVEVNLEKDIVTLGIVACDTCNKTDPPTYNKASVVFQFPKGSLAKASAGDIEDTIGQLLSISDSSQQDQGGGQQGGQDQQQGAQGDQQAAQQPAQQQAPAAEPQTIEKGQTTDQVQGSLGKPDKIVNLGAKQIWVYKDLKVTFLNGKVSDVQ
ncbi:MAG TPA: hypothetical protein VKF84_01000 [Candidatus Sulfotelmatobacter sp.]|nr:hypothetical protein [Candidatus Sulfotelmatobacter sp.]